MKKLRTRKHEVVLNRSVGGDIGINVLLIIMEGCGGTLVNAVDPQADAAITPNLNRLAREGVFFSRCYANSFRTDRGTACALRGYPAFPDVSHRGVAQASWICHGLSLRRRHQFHEHQRLSALNGL